MINRLYLRTVLSSLVLLTLASIGAAQDDTNPIVAQNTALSISGVNIGINSLDYVVTPAGIDISVEYSNNTGRTAIALSLGFVLIDPFNDIVGIAFGEARNSISPDALRSQTWSFDDIPDADRTTYVVAYPYAVRLDDQAVRKASGNNVASILSEQLGIEVDVPTSSFVR